MNVEMVRDSSATPAQTSSILLEPARKNSKLGNFEQQLRERIIGQDEAVSQFVDIYGAVMAKMTMPGRPIANLLLLGPTGSGKTRIVEAMAEILFDNPRAFIKVDCAEFQHSHEISKLIGSPPGYIGHRETRVVLSQGAIDQFQTEALKLTFVLFDEIEKANESLWQLLLGVLDKGTLTLGDNQRVDLSKTIIVLTSNLGAGGLSRAVSGSIGFIPGSRAHMDKRVNSVALSAAKGRFSPEFLNRIDKTIVFASLSPDHLHQILDIELKQVQNRILSPESECIYAFKCTVEAKRFLVKRGTLSEYGARHLKRTIEQDLVTPLTRLVSTDQIVKGDHITVGLGYDEQGEAKLVFSKTPSAV